MRIKVVNHLNDNDVAINQQLSNITINRYRAGLEKQESQDVAESTNTGTVDVVNPTETINVAKPKKTSSIKSGLQISEGYSSKKQFKIKSTSSTAATNSSATAKEFITQSRVFDNELDHMVALMKLNNKNAFYSGGSFTSEEKKHLENIATDDEIVELFEKLLDDLSRQEANGEDSTDTYKKISYLEHMASDLSEIIHEFGIYKNAPQEDKDIIDDVIRRSKSLIPMSLQLSMNWVI